MLFVIKVIVDVICLAIWVFLNLGAIEGCLRDDKASERFILSTVASLALLGIPILLFS